MGIDAVIYIKTLTGEYPCLGNPLPKGFEIKETPQWGPEGATHEVNTYARFYGPHYERGPWPIICAALMELYACLDIETIWYGGDCDDSPHEFTSEDILKYCDHYMKNGQRPYLGRAQMVPSMAWSPCSQIVRNLSSQESCQNSELNNKGK